MALERTFSIVKPDGVARNLIGRSSPASKRPASRSSPRACSTCRSVTPKVSTPSSAASVLQGPREVHDLRSGASAGARRRERDSQEPRDHGRHGSEEGRARTPSAPISPRASKRTPCTARTRRKPPPRKSPTSSARRRSARAAEAPGNPLITAMSAEPAIATTNLLGLSKPELEAFVAELGSKPFRARQLDELAVQARRERHRRR